jgi:hypothetical protein
MSGTCVVEGHQPIKTVQDGGDYNIISVTLAKRVARRYSSPGPTTHPFQASIASECHLCRFSIRIVHNKIKYNKDMQMHPSSMISMR